MKNKNIPLKVGGTYTLYTYSEVSQTAYKIELTMLNVFPEVVEISDSVEGREAVGTARVRGVNAPISLQVRINEDIIIPNWDQLDIETVPQGICFLGELEACFTLMLNNVNSLVENHDHCFYRDQLMEEAAIIFPLRS